VRGVLGAETRPLACAAVRAETTRRLGLGALALAVAVGVAFRLYTQSELWLDEALTVNIARLSPGDMFEQLRRDGHPPLYYLLLHYWMEVFGDGNEATRLLSGLFGIATLPLLYVAARRWAGRTVAVGAVVLFATSPFAVRYATEVRMYSMVTFLVVAGWLVLRRALDEPTPKWLALVALLAGLLALTHYWSFYLLAATGLVLLWRWRRGSAAALKAAIALVVGGVLFLPWLPSFLEQAGQTGTPWGRPERPTQIFFISFTDWGGGPNGEAQMVGYGILILVLLALFARSRDRHHVELDLTTVPLARAEAGVVALTMAIACVASYAAAAAFASRYTAVVFPLVLALAGLGAAAFAPNRKAWVGILVVLSLFGVVGMSRNARGERTQAGHIARYIREQGAPGDVVAFCPDQLGPSTMRLLPDTFVGLTFPEGGDPNFVNWVDYADRQKERTPAQFAELVDAKATDAQTVWLVWSEGYRTVGKKCRRTVNALKKLRRGGAAVRASGPQFEHAWLYQYGPDPERGAP